MIWGIASLFSLQFAMWYCEILYRFNLARMRVLISSVTRMSNKFSINRHLATGSTFLVGSIMMIDDEGFRSLSN